MAIRILVDEDLSPRIAQLLWEAGFEATCCRDRGLLGWKDWQLLPWLAREGWTILTDNGPEWERRMQEWNSAGNDHHGLIVARQYGGTDLIAAELIRYLREEAPQSLQNQIAALNLPGPNADC